MRTKEEREKAVKAFQEETDKVVEQSKSELPKKKKPAKKDKK